MTYENHYHATEEMYREYIRKVLCRRLRLLEIVLVVLAGLSIILGIILDERVLFDIGCIALVVFAAERLFARRIMLKQLIDYDKKLYQGASEECVVTFDSAITMKSGEKLSITIEYGQIKAIYKLKTCNILMFTPQNGIMYVDSGFTGDASGFDAFITAQCKNAKIIVDR